MKKKRLFFLLPFFTLMSLAGVLYAQNDHYPEFMEMGNRAYASEKYDLAIGYYQSALDDKPDCWQAYVGLGNCYYYKKKLKDSLQAYEKALKMNPGNDEVIRFVQFLRKKIGATALPTPTPSPLPNALPGLPPLQLPGDTNPK